MEVLQPRHGHTSTIEVKSYFQNKIQQECQVFFCRPLHYSCCSGIVNSGELAMSLTWTSPMIFRHKGLAASLQHSHGKRPISIDLHQFFASSKDTEL